MSSSSFVVGPKESGQTLAALLRGRLGLSWSRAKQLVERRQVRVNGATCPDPARRLRPGQRVDLATDTPGERKARSPRTPADRKPTPAPRPSTEKKTAEAAPVVVYADDQIVVVDKPPGLTTMRHPEEAAEFGARAKRFLPDTLADRLPSLLGDRRPVIAVHRLDRDTSGLVVFAHTRPAAEHLVKQFRGHTIERRYLAIVRGRAEAGRVESHLVRDRGDGRRGSGPPSKDAQRAVTHVRMLEHLGGHSLVECRLETGRTHQVRIHLGERGTPLCGERVYDRPPHGAPASDDSGAPRVALHAAVLGFTHPLTGERLRFESPLPDDLAAILERLRKRG